MNGMHQQPMGCLFLCPSHRVLHACLRATRPASSPLLATAKQILAKPGPVPAFHWAGWLPQRVPAGPGITCHFMQMAMRIACKCTCSHCWLTPSGTLSARQVLRRPLVPTTPAWLDRRPVPPTPTPTHACARTAV